MTRASGVVIWLTVLWVLLWGDISWANVLSGIAVAFAVVSIARLPRAARATDDGVARIHPLRTLWFGVYVLYKLIESNMVLAWEIVTPRNKINSGVVAVPLRTESEMAMMVVANIITLTPGTLTIEVYGSPPVVFVNVLHLHDIERGAGRSAPHRRAGRAGLRIPRRARPARRGDRPMTTIAFILLSLAAILFVIRLTIGPTVADRVIAADGLLITVMCGVIVAAVEDNSAIGIDAVLVVAMLGFIATGVLARFIEQRGGR